MNKFRNLMKPKVLLGGLVLATAMTIGWGAIGNSSAYAASCDTNDIMPCGYNNASDFAAKYKSNAKGDYDNIYAKLGMSSSELSRFQSTAKHATVYKDGRVVLDDGTVVATNAHSMGREKHGEGRKEMSIDGKTYYYSATKDSFNSDKLSAYVMLNPDTHALEFAALTACGNPVWGTSPGYKCEDLKKEKVSDTTYNFSANTYASNASLTKLVYDFGDGQSKTVTSNFGQKVAHTYKPGKFTAKVTAYFNVNGKEKIDARAQCTTPVEVPQPPKPPKPVFACTNLTMVVKNKTEREYTFTVGSSYANGPVLASADFNFGDGQSQNGVKANADKKTATVTHKFSKTFEGNIAIKATVKSNTGLSATAPACEVKLTFKKDIVYCKPNIPVGDARCTDYCKPGIPVGDDKCKNYCKPGIEVGSDDCKEYCKPGIEEGSKDCKEYCKPDVEVGSKGCEDVPAELPSTGPTDILIGTMGMGTLVGAASYYRNSRRNLLSIFKR